MRHCRTCNCFDSFKDSEECPVCGVQVIKTGILNHIVAKASAEGRNSALGKEHLRFVKSGKYDKMKREHRKLYNK